MFKQDLKVFLTGLTLLEGLKDLVVIVLLLQALRLKKVSAHCPVLRSRARVGSPGQWSETSFRSSAKGKGVARITRGKMCMQKVHAWESDSPAGCGCGHNLLRRRQCQPPLSLQVGLQGSEEKKGHILQLSQ